MLANYEAAERGGGFPDSQWIDAEPGPADEAISFRDGFTVQTPFIGFRVIKPIHQ